MASDNSDIFSNVLGLGTSIANWAGQRAGGNALQNGLQSNMATVDPLSASRPGYVNQLNSFMSDPSSFLQSPYAKNIMDAGTQAVARSGAAKGFLGSGNMATALSDYGQKTATSLMDNRFNQLFQLSGGNQGMQAAGDLAQSITGVNAARAGGALGGAGVAGTLSSLAGVGKNAYGLYNSLSGGADAAAGYANGIFGGAGIPGGAWGADASAGLSNLGVTGTAADFGGALDMGGGAITNGIVDSSALGGAGIDLGIGTGFGTGAGSLGSLGVTGGAADWGAGAAGMSAFGEAGGAGAAAGGAGMAAAGFAAPALASIYEFGNFLGSFGEDPAANAASWRNWDSKSMDQKRADLVSGERNSRSVTNADPYADYGGTLNGMTYDQYLNSLFSDDYINNFGLGAPRS